MSQQTPKTPSHERIWELKQAMSTEGCYSLNLCICLTDLAYSNPELFHKIEQFLEYTTGKREAAIARVRAVGERLKAEKTELSAQVEV